MTAKPFCDGPFSILKGTSWIVGKDHHGEPCHVLDQRGWGYLTGKGQSALGLDNATASAMQAETQQWVVDAMNAAWNRSAVQPAQVQPDPRDEVIKGLVEAATDAAEAIDMAYGSDDDESPHRHSAKLRAALAAAKAVQHG